MTAPIPPVGPCVRYVSGHSVHWIQARLTWNQPKPHTRVEVIGFEGSQIVVATLHDVRRLANHDVERVRAIVAEHGPLGALVGYGVLRLDSGQLICVKDESEGPLGACSD